MAISCDLTLRTIKGSKLTFNELDSNFLNLRNCIYQLNTTDTFVTGGTYNPSTTSLDFVGNSDFNPFSVNVSGLLDTFVSGGTYNPTTGCATFVTNSGTTFDVCGFLTGATGTAEVVWTGGSAGNYSVKQITDTTTDATGNYSVAQGFKTLASGDYSTASGYGTLASGTRSTSSGNYTTASGDYSTASGIDSTASGFVSHAEGNSTASGDYSHSEGISNTASGAYSHAEGQGNIASGSGSHSEGGDNTASGEYSHAEGGENMVSGNYSHAEGNNTTASGDYSHTEGQGTQATGTTSHAEGYLTKAHGDYSHSEGQQTQATGATSHAEGYLTKAFGTYSHSEGRQTTASGNISHAEGFGSTASGYVSHAEGSSTASGQYSHSEGVGTTASAYGAHAQNEQNTASVANSHAGGFNSTASGQQSFIHSTNSLVTGNRSVVLGGQNLTGATADTVYVPYLNINNLGTGTSINNLGIDSNGFVVTGTTGGGAGTIVTGFTYSNNNFTISQSGGVSDLVSNISVMTGLTVNGQTTMSGNGQSVLTVIGSGATEPIFTVQGSSGELFSITDSLVGSLFAVNDISGLPILEVFDNDTVLMGNFQAPSLNTTVYSTPPASQSIIYTLPTSAYTGGFFEYTATLDGVGGRSGSINSYWSGTSEVIFTDVTSGSIGDTSGVLFNFDFSGNNVNFNVSANTSGWEIKTIVRSI